MFGKLREGFISGVEKIRWFSTVFYERLMIEIAVIKLLYGASEMEKKREELLKTIGERVYELREHHDKNLLKDKTVADAIAEIERIGRDVEAIKQRISEIGGARA